MRRALAARAALGVMLGLPEPAGAGSPVLAGVERRSPVVQVVEEVAPAVVNIATDQRVENPFGTSPFGRLLRDFFDVQPPGRQDRYVQNSLGSGVIVDPAGYVATNEHVIWGASRIRVTLQDGRTLLADVVGTDAESDLAVLKLDGQGPFPAVRLGRSDDLLIGETVIAIGNPYGFSSSVTTGVVSAVGRSIESGDRVFSDYIQTDALINPGNSGGPLLNIRGELIGVNNSVYAPAQGIGFAIPVNRVRRVVGDLINYGKVRHPWFGLMVEEFHPAGGPPALGRKPALRIQRVFIGGPADAAGLRPGDRIRALAGRVIDSRADFDTALSELQVGRSVRMEVERDGRPISATLTGTAFPAGKAGAYLAEVTGLELEEIPDRLRARYRFLPDAGLLVTEVRPGSRAERLGLRPGDVVVRMDRERVSGLEDLDRLVPQILTRSSFFMVVVRGRVAYNLTFRLL